MFPSKVNVILLFADLGSMAAWFAERQVMQINGFVACSPFYADGMHSLLHRCLQLSPCIATGSGLNRCQMHETVEDAFENALRCAMLLFLGNIRRRWGIPATGTELCLSQLRNALGICLKEKGAVAELQRLIFWMLVIGGMEAARYDGEADWFCSCIVARCAAVGATAFEDIEATVERAMTGLVWLDEFSGSELVLLLDQVRQDLLRSQIEGEG